MKIYFAAVMSFLSNEKKREEDREREKERGEKHFHGRWSRFAVLLRVIRADASPNPPS